ncbi:HAD-IC family P-type ATPase [Nonomuraea fuscirosea]
MGDRSSAASAAETAGRLTGRVTDPGEPLPLLRKELGTGPGGLSEREAARRLAVYGLNQVRRHERTSPAGEVTRQVAHPLALLLWAAGALAFVAGTPVLGWAILAVIVVNAAFALLQERQAERAVEALASYLPEHAKVIRDSRPRTVEATQLVPGDLVLLEEGDRVPADARLVDGAVEVDLSMLTGESAPVERITGPAQEGVPLLSEPNLVFSGTTCVGGQATALVFATGEHTELGRISALSQRTRRRPSPLEVQVKKVAWLIAAVAVAIGVVFLLTGMWVGLPLRDALTFAIGLLVANVPEGLLPTITLALAIGVRVLARQGAVIKRLSAVETLGSTSVICTDKTGTLTQNRMRLQAIWSPRTGDVPQEDRRPLPRDLARVLIDCSTCHLDEHGRLQGDPTEIALVEGAAGAKQDTRADAAAPGSRTCWPTETPESSSCSASMPGCG